MKRFFSGMAYGAAVLTILFALALPIKILPIFLSIVEAMNLKISPLYSGGELAFVIEREGHCIEVFRPVFPALIGEGSQGFVQMVWTPRNTLPAEVHETIDFNRDGIIDMDIAFTNPPGNSPAPVLTVYPRSPWVKAVHQSATTSFAEVLIEKVGNSMYIRVPLQKPKKP
jgi:hypothetical protein